MDEDERVSELEKRVAKLESDQAQLIAAMKQQQKAIEALVRGHKAARHPPRYK
jgi:exonuclease VII small subunit